MLWELAFASCATKGRMGSQFGFYSAISTSAVERALKRPGLAWSWFDGGKS